MEDDMDDNMQDKNPLVSRNASIVAATKIRKFNDIEMEEIRKFHGDFKSYAKTMSKYNISSKGTLNYILNKNYVTTK